MVLEIRIHARRSARMAVVAIIVVASALLLTACREKPLEIPSPPALREAPAWSSLCGADFEGRIVRLGDRQDTIVAIDRYVETTAETFDEHACSDDATFVEIGWAMYARGMVLLRGRRAADGVALIRLAAERYANPVAMTQLARIYFYGAYRMRLKGVAIEPNPDRALFWVSTAFRVAKLDAERTGSGIVLSRVKNTAWMLTERLNVMAQKGEFDQRAALLAQRESIMAAVEHHRALYFPGAPAQHAPPAAP